ERPPVLSEHVAPRDHYVDLTSTGGHRTGYLLDPGTEGRQSGRETRRDCCDWYSTALEGLHRRRNHLVVHAHRADLDAQVRDPELFEEIASDRVDSLGAQAPHAAGSVITSQRRQVDEGYGLEQP